MKRVEIVNLICRIFFVLLIAFVGIDAFGQNENNIELTKAINQSKHNHEVYNSGSYENLVASESLSSEIIKKYLGEKSSEYRTSVFNLSLYLSESDSIEAAIRNLEYVQQSISNDEIDHDYWQAYCASWLSYYYAIYCIVDLDNISSLWKINEKSDDCSKIALAYFEKHPEYEIEYAQALTHSSLRDSKDTAIKTCKKALSLYKKNGIDENDLEYIYTQSIYLQKLADKKSSMPITFNYKRDYCRTEQRRKENRNKLQPILLKGLENHTKIINSNQLWEEDIECHRAIYEAYKEIYGENEVCADLLCSLADKYSSFNNSTKAYESFNLAQQMYENAGVGKKNTYLEHRFKFKEYIDSLKISSNPLALYEELLFRHRLYESYANCVLRQTDLFNVHCRGTKEAQSYGYEYQRCHRINNEGYGYIMPANYGYEGPLDNPVTVYAWVDNYSSTLEAAGDSIKARIKRLSKGSSEYADKVYALSRYYYYKGEYEKMLTNAEDASAQYRLIYGRENKTYIASQQNLSLLYNMLIWKSLSSKKFSKAKFYKEKLYRSVEEIIICSRDVVNKNILRYTSSERELFWEQYSEWFNEVLPYLSLIEGFENVVLEGLSFSDNFLFNCDLRIRNFALTSNSEIIHKDWKDYWDSKDALIHLQSSSDVKSDELDYFSHLCNERERDLLSDISKVGGFTDLKSEGVMASLYNCIDDSSAIIYFLNFKNLALEQLYCAAVIEKGQNHPVIIPLFTENEFDSPLQKKDYSTPRLYSMIWKPLENYLSSKDNVYIIPSGVLCKEGVEYFPDTEGIVPSSKWNIYRLSSVQEILARHNSDYDGNVKAALYGGLIYDLDVDAMVRASSNYESINPYLVNRSVPEDILRSRFVKLAGTLVEVNAISETISQIPESNVTIYCDTLGNEESVRMLSGKNNKIIHFATHGFYWTTNDLKKQESKHRLAFLNTIRMENSIITKEDRTMTRSGLALSGANSVLKGYEIPIGVEDGILTAAEASMLDLSGCDLLVLSACQTALGDIIKGEGVYGLQRGFKKAGVNSILMSLWKVNDRATSLLMTEFYKNYLCGESKINSLRKAQEYMRTLPDYKDPQYWAGFVLLDAL